MIHCADSDKGDVSRKEMGLEWMLRPKENIEQTPATTSDNKVEEVQPEAEEVKFPFHCHP